MEKEQFGSRFHKGRGNASESKNVSLKMYNSSFFKAKRDEIEKKRESDRAATRGFADRGGEKNEGGRRHFVVNPEGAGRRPRVRIADEQRQQKFGNEKFERFEEKKKAPKKKGKRIIEKPNYDSTPFVDYSKPMRLNRFLANAGVCSRREADNYIMAGVVSVNGKVVTELGSRVIPCVDRVMFHDQLVSIEHRVYILLNKPKDFVTTAEDIHAHKTVLDLVKGACSERIYPVGRLDRNTTGVLLLTNDGELTSKLTHPSFNKKKVYQVTLDKDVTDEDVEKITTGITLEDGDIKVDEFNFVKEEDRKTVGVEIHSGRNRIVRRIFESLGYKVVRLDRVYFAGLTKKNLPRGKWRFLSEQEVAYLKMNANNPTENC